MLCMDIGVERYIDSYSIYYLIGCKFNLSRVYTSYVYIIFFIKKFKNKKSNVVCAFALF